MIYRMRQIRDLTGRDLGDARDRLLFSLALVALALFAAVPTDAVAQEQRVPGHGRT